MKKVFIKTEQEIFDEIASGKYREHYLIYNRKSTDEADNQKNSISYQKTENMRFAFREKLPIAKFSLKGFCADGVISEKHSGFKEDDNFTISENGMVQYQIDRPKFQKMLQLVNQGHIRGLVCLCWDRISRNKGDDTLIRKLMRKGVDIRFTYAHYDDTSAGALHMDIDGMFSQHHSRVTSEKVTITTRNAREKGICTYRAPIGYLNLGEMEHKPFDPERAPVIKQMFEYYATGEWSLSDLVRYAKQQGFVTVPMRRRRTQDEMLAEEDETVELEKVSRIINENTVSRILTNRFYTGKILDSNGKYIDSISHEALVDDELFEQVQAILHKKKVSIHYTEKLDLPFRGMIRCELCERVYTPYIKKGITYYNSRCVKDCPNSLKNINFSYLSDKFGGLLSDLCFTDEQIAQMDAHISTGIALLEEKRNKNFESIERQKKKLREDLAYMRSNKIVLLKTGVYTPEGYVEEEKKYDEQLEKLKTDENVSDVAMRETMKDVWKLSELVKDLIPQYDFAEPHEKEKIARVIFSELSLSQNTLKYKCKNGFQCLENRLNAVCDPPENRTLI
ncbi:MAG: recombinase family protein [Candidatus Parcubacteria bacterium]|nr:recombinase family protein [Candidatus Parcubacteria bacterium]